MSFQPAWKVRVCDRCGVPGVFVSGECWNLLKCEYCADVVRAIVVRKYAALTGVVIAGLTDVRL